MESINVDQGHAKHIRKTIQIFRATYIRVFTYNACIARLQKILRVTLWTFKMRSTVKRFMLLCYLSIQLL